jgi:hypothetical protein
MSDQEISEDQLEPEDERIILPAPRTKEAAEELLRALPDIKVFGLLLVSNPGHPINNVIRNRWSELHHLTGNSIALVAFQPPVQWAPSLEDFWREQLGSSFQQTWADWQSGRGLEGGVALDYLDLVREPQLKPSDLPCLALFTSLDDTRAVIRPLPNWDEDSLFNLMTTILKTVGECAAETESERLDCLRKRLTSPQVHAWTTLGHVGQQIYDYLRQHPALAVTTSVSVVLALATGNVLPLSVAVVEALKIVKDTFAKG